MSTDLLYLTKSQKYTKITPDRVAIQIFCFENFLLSLFNILS